VNTKGEQGAQGPVGPEGPQGEQGETGISIVSFTPKSETSTTLIYTVTFSDGHTQDVPIPKGAKGDTGATGPQGQKGDTGVSITSFTYASETETDMIYTVTFSDSTTQQVSIPKGAKGDTGTQGPVGPQGPQGPMGDVAVITPEQQAAFTMYSVPGQNTDGPMTQKAVTDALVAGSISYDNSQSGLASENVQGAIDNLSEGSILWMNTGLQNADSSFGLLDTSTAKFVNVTNSKYTHAVIKTEGFDFVRITAGSLSASFGFVTQYNRPQIDSNVYYCAGNSRINIPANTTRAYQIPQDCQYIVVNGQGNKNNYAPSLIEFGKWNNVEIIDNSNDIISLSKEKIKYETIDLESSTTYPNHNGILLETVFLADSSTRWHRVIPRDTNAKTLKVTARTDYITRFAFVKTYTQPTTRGELIDLCDNQYRSINISAGETKEFLIPDDCTYIIVNRFSSSSNWMPHYIGFGYDNTASLDDVEEMRNEITGDVQYEYTVVTGTWDTPTGTLGSTSQSARKATDYIEVGDAEYIIKEKDASLVSYYMLFYDYDKNYIGFSSAEIAEDKYRFKVLNGAYYFVNNLTTSSQDVSSVKFRSYGKKEKLTYSEGIDVKLSDFMNSQQTDQKNIEDCLSFVSGFEKKTIHFDVERLVVSRAILLESNTTILLEDCVIKQADETFDNVFRSANLNPNGNGGQDMPSTIPILENIKIIGVGKANIIGPDVNASSGGTPLVGDAYGFRTWQICMVRINGFELSNVSFTKTRCWCITFELCENVSVHDLSIRSNVKNGDGIDFRVGCKHCEVYNMFASTLDDAIACTALGAIAERTGEYCSSPTWKLWQSIIDTNPSSLDIEDVSVRNIDFSQTVNTSFNGGHGMICLSAYGSKVHNVSIDKFKEVAVGGNNNDGLIKIYHGYGSGYTAGDLNTIRLNNIVCTHFPYTLQVTGGIVEDVRANKLVNNASGGATVSVSSGNVIGTNVIVTNS
jgi:hypothetical protein